MAKAKKARKARIGHELSGTMHGSIAYMSSTQGCNYTSRPTRRNSRVSPEAKKLVLFFFFFFASARIEFVPLENADADVDPSLMEMGDYLRRSEGELAFATWDWDSGWMWQRLNPTLTPFRLWKRCSRSSPSMFGSRHSSNFNSMMKKVLPRLSVQRVMYFVCMRSPNFIDFHGLRAMYPQWHDG